MNEGCPRDRQSRLHLLCHRPRPHPARIFVTSLTPDKITFDGESLPSVLLGQSKKSKNKMMFFRRPPDRDRFYGVNDLPDLAIRNGRWKLLCEYDGSSPLLYDLFNRIREGNQKPGKTKDAIWLQN